jgi:SAM-dependent methyltransferase
MLDSVVRPEAADSILKRCRACLAPDPYLYLPMGLHAPAQMLLKAEDAAAEHPAFPLNTQVCLECGLVEIADQIPADFFRHYLYVPSGAATMHTHFGEFAMVLADRAGQDGLIVDIGCNDGLLLAACNALGATTLGIDPAANIAEMAKEKCVEVFVDYFHPGTAKVVRERYGSAKVIVTTNTFNHIGDLHGFMRGIDILLADDGVFVIEVPRAKEMIDHNEFENIYHEHVSEFSLLSIARLGEFFEMVVTDVTHLPNIHGGSMRVFLTRADAGFATAPQVARMLGEELTGGMLEAATYDALAWRVDAMGLELRAMLDRLKAEGKTIAGYGASARGNTLLTYFGIGTQYLDFLVDKNPLKQGMVTPNTRIPIRPVEAIEEERPDVLFMLAWNFFAEIRGQQAAFEARGGRFLVPLPSPRLVG